jgi:RsiW-degrading membrane proteinase PrsW (M82 family)
MDIASGVIAGVLWGVIPTVLFLFLVWWLDRHEKEPLQLLLVSLVGGLAAFAIMLVLEAALGLRLGLVPAYVSLEDVGPGPRILAEIVKAVVLVVLVYWLGSEFDGPLDGIVYGGVLGAGFALGQNQLYFSSAAMQYWGLESVSFPTELAIAISSFNHAFYSALFGLSLGYLRVAPRPRTVWWVPLLGLAAALGFVLIHDWLPRLSERLAATWPAELLVWIGLLLQLSNGLGLVALGVVVAWAWEQEENVVEEHLRDEVEAGVVTPEDYEALSSSFGRLAREFDALVSRGVHYWLALRQLHELEVELAYRKWHSAKRHALRGPERRHGEAEYRAQIADVRARLARWEGAFR